ncbi:MAG TPA: hypothetical protein VIF37_05490 [Methylobacter sp.]|jgi:hypothetical protein
MQTIIDLTELAEGDIMLNYFKRKIMTNVLVVQVAQPKLSLPTFRHTATLLHSPITSWITLPPLSFGLHLLHSRSHRAG